MKYAWWAIKGFVLKIPRMNKLWNLDHRIICFIGFLYKENKIKGKVWRRSNYFKKILIYI